MADFFSGEPAARRVADDPFWSVVRRRHPDVDVVVLPPERRPPATVPAPRGGEEPPPIRPDDAETAYDGRAAELWRDLVGAEPTGRRARWLAADGGRSRREVTWRLDGADPVAGVAAIERAATALADSGWHVLAPPDGMPRVLAGRGVEAGRDELQFVLAPAEGRLVLRLRFAPVRLEGADR